MATIFPKVNTILGFDNTLVLDHREALLYPFDVGNDWREIRVGMFVSIVGSTGDNSTYNDESVANTSNLNRGYIGIKNNNTIFPGASGSNYIGASNGLNQPVNILNANNFINFNGASVQIAADNITNTRAASADTYVGTRLVGTQLINYAAFYGLRVWYNPANNIMSGVMIHHPNSYYTDTSITTLRVLTTSPPTQTTPPTTGYFTSDLTISGSPLSRPEAVFVYFPFFTDKFRIHSLLVERYA